MTLPVSRRVEFGLGLIGIGKPWGFAKPEVPSESQAIANCERFILERHFEGVVLSGTKESEHLQENWDDFGEESRRRRAG